MPKNGPGRASNAATWEGYTLDRWVDENSKSQQFRQLVRVATRPIFGAEPRELSLLFVLFYIASSGNETNPGTFERNFNTRGGAQQQRFVGGSQLIPIKMGAQLGKRIILPPWLESQREQVEARLTPLPDPRADWPARTVSAAAREG